MEKYLLVGDIGGTNARLALCCLSSGNICHAKSYSGMEFVSLKALITCYLTEQQIQVTQACIAIACPVQGDWVEMTNYHWAFSITEMKQQLQFDNLQVINDFTAAAMAIPVLKQEHVIQIGGDKPLPNSPIAVYGAGTGLGVAHLMPVEGRWIPLPGEGGHVDLAATSAQEDAILALLRQRFGRVSVERILSGSGLVNLYQALVVADNRVPEQLLPKMITERALVYRDKDCQDTLSLFCQIMGRFGGNLALNLSTFGGVYIAGGIVPRFLSFFQQSDFRAAFDNKGRVKTLVESIPVYLIVHDNPGLLGAGAYLRQQLGYLLS